MRRIHLALVLIALVVFCVAFSAQAAYAGTESGYVTWTADPPNDNPATPHKGYATTTQKCAVCHAVHKAPADGELLLRGSAGDSCTYCHVTGDIGRVVVYGGVIDRYTTEDDRGHQSPAVTCISCHAVHGANTFGGDNATKILKVFGIQDTFVDYITEGSGEASRVVNATNADTFPGGWDAGQIQDTAFCSQCHPYYSPASETTVTASVVQSDGSYQTTSFKTHPMKLPGNESGRDPYYGFEAQGSSVPTSQTIAVYSTRGCNWNCHWSQDGGIDRGAGVWENSYPHHNPNTSRFLAGGPNDSVRDGVVEDSSQDSACLMCHLYSGRTNDWAVPRPEGGVGVSY